MKFNSEQEFLNNTMISRKYYTGEPWNCERKSKFMFYKLNDLNEPFYDSGDLTLQYFSKLVCWRENENYARFYLHNTQKKYFIRLPLNNGCTVGEKSDMESKIFLELDKAHDNYHEDWPGELKQMDLDVNGVSRTYHFFNVLSHR